MYSIKEFAAYVKSVSNTNLENFLAEGVKSEPETRESEEVRYEKNGYGIAKGAHVGESYFFAFYPVKE